MVLKEAGRGEYTRGGGEVLIESLEEVASSSLKGLIRRSTEDIPLSFPSVSPSGLCGRFTLPPDGSASCFLFLDRLLLLVNVEGRLSLPSGKGIVLTDVSASNTTVEEGEDESLLG